MPGHGANATHQRTAERQAPGQASCGIAPLIITPHTSAPGGRSASARAIMPARARRGSTAYVRHPSLRRLRRNPGGCLQPVLLRGRVDHIDGATGELLHRYSTVHEPGGVCRSRARPAAPPAAHRARRCTAPTPTSSSAPGCPAARASRHVATHPCVFTTLTAPSFGPSTSPARKDGQLQRCRPRDAPDLPHGRRMSCPDRHARDDARLGEPLCPDCYDYTGSVLFNACAPELWRRFTITLRRPSPARPADEQGPGRPAAGFFRQGRRVPAPRRGPLPRHHPPRRPHRAGTRPARLGHPRPADRRHRPGRRRRPPRHPAAPGLPARTLAGDASTTPGRSPPPGNSPIPGSPPTSPSTPPRPPNAPAPSTAASPPPTAWPSCPSASTPAASSPPACA
jgi:hypothetical protein